MAWFAEQLLYGLVRCFYRTEIAHSSDMKEALTDANRAREYRAGQVDRIIAAAGRYGVQIDGCDVLDLGCNDGAMTVDYPRRGARRVIGVDIDSEAISYARRRRADAGVEFQACTTTTIPLEDSVVDVIICFDVFEHVARPAEVLAECKRVLRPGGRILIGTWGWYHPFAPHLWATMPVPWAHVFFSERTILRTCRQVFHSSWYVPNRHDVDENGLKKADKFLAEEIPTDYLNKLMIDDFDKLCQNSGMAYQIHLIPFGSGYASWTQVFLKLPYLREFFTSYLWIVLTCPGDEATSYAGGDTQVAEKPAARSQR